MTKTYSMKKGTVRVRNWRGFNHQYSMTTKMYSMKEGTARVQDWHHNKKRRIV